jgi:hypothetical protein
LEDLHIQVQNTCFIGSSILRTGMETSMQLSENVKSQILNKEGEIFTLTDEIFNLLINCKKNQSELMNRMLRIIFILSDLCAISNNLILVPELNLFKNDFLSIHAMFVQDERQIIIQNRIQKFCIDANSVILYKK